MRKRWSFHTKVVSLVWQNQLFNKLNTEKNDRKASFNIIRTQIKCRITSKIQENPFQRKAGYSYFTDCNRTKSPIKLNMTFLKFKNEYYHRLEFEKQITKMVPFAYFCCFVSELWSVKCHFF